MIPSTDSPDETPNPVTVGAALQWARVLNLLKQHGITGAIIILLFYQLGIFAQAQSVGCGI